MNSYTALARYYDRFTEDVDYEGLCRFVQAAFAREGLSPRLVLDLACGTGTLTALLAKKGYEMIGVDASPDMLMQAADHVAALSPAPLLLCQRMERLDLYGTVDACLCCLDSLNYITDVRKLKEALRRVHLFLEPGGLFLFDINTPHKFQMLDGQSFVREDEDVFCVWQAALEGALCHYQFDIFEKAQNGWQRSGEAHTERIYPPDELVRLLQELGFTDIKQYADRDFSAPTGQEDRLYFTARKE